MIYPGLIVEVRNVRTGESIADSAIVLARGDGRVDTLTPGGVSRDGVLQYRQGAWDRPGVYVVEVRRMGYQSWRASDVKVERGPCSMNPVLLRASLQPDH